MDRSPAIIAIAALILASAAGCRTTASEAEGEATPTEAPREAATLRVADLTELDTSLPPEGILAAWLRLAANPFEGEGLAPLADHAAATGARLVLLGESTHGTEEWYTLRAAISRHLIAHHGFRFIAVEGDWDAIDRLNAYARGESEASSAREVMAGFDRWPTWMWANEPFADLVEWLAEHNADRPEEERVGVYGVDLYGDGDSAQRVAELLGDGDVRAVLPCMGPFAGDGQRYRGAIAGGAPSCAPELEALVARTRAPTPTEAGERRRMLRARANALVLKHAERHHRAIAGGGPEGWNSRARFFFRITEELLAFYDKEGAPSRGMVWAHNTHVGDARATPMGQGGRTNIGQDAREAFGREGTFAIGFGTRTGEVLAGARWGAPVEAMRMPPAPSGSWEALMATVEEPRFFFLLRDAPIPDAARPERGHRAVGVSYDPRRDAGHWVPSRLPDRYDAFVYVDETRALRAP